MITFKQKGKFEYQLLCHAKSPLDISLLPNNTMSNNFDTAISSIQAMSEIMGKVFDDYIFNFVNGYATGNSQHNSRTTERRAFKFPDEKTDCDESEYDANYFEKHKNMVPLILFMNNPHVPSILSRT